MLIPLKCCMAFVQVLKVQIAIKKKLSGRGERYYKKKLQTLHGQKGHRDWKSGEEK